MCRWSSRSKFVFFFANIILVFNHRKILKYFICGDYNAVFFDWNFWSYTICATTDENMKLEDHLNKVITIRKKNGLTYKKTECILSQKKNTAQRVSYILQGIFIKYYINISGIFYKKRKQFTKTNICKKCFHR